MIQAPYRRDTHPSTEPGAEAAPPTRSSSAPGGGAAAPGSGTHSAPSAAARPSGGMNLRCAPSGRRSAGSQPGAAVPAMTRPSATSATGCSLTASGPALSRHSDVTTRPSVTLSAALHAQVQHGWRRVPLLCSRGQHPWASAAAKLSHPSTRPTDLPSECWLCGLATGHA